MVTNEKLHTSNIISSLNKIYNQSRLNGQLNSKDIYIVDSIYKLLNGCETSLNDFQKKTLNSLYNNIISSSKYVCNNTIYKSYEVTSKDKFIQAESIDCNTLPTQDLIYYWQEPLGITSSVIVNNIAEGDYLDTKTSDLKTVFENGKDINYTDIGLICFALNKAVSTAEYAIYDDEEVNVINGFESFYNDDLNTRIFISYNIYSHGIMNFKIKRI